MSIDDTPVAETTPTEDAPAFSVNRRTLMKTAAGAGVAAAAVGIVGVAHASGTPRQAVDASLAGGAPLAGAAQPAISAVAPLVVHVSDLANGTLEIFTNGARTQVTDVDLARRIATAAN